LWVSLVQNDGRGVAVVRTPDAIGKLALVAFVSASLVAPSGDAAEITVTATGRVTEVSHEAGFQGDGFPFPDLQVGDPFGVSFSYDDASGFPQSDPNRTHITNPAMTVTITTADKTVSGTAGMNSVDIRNDDPGDSVSMGGIFLGRSSYGFSLAGDTRPLSSPTLSSGNVGLLPGWDPSQATFVFQYDGYGYFGDGTFRGAIDVVPEPATGLLVLLGLAGLRRKRRL
jgi:hypothetical protein